MHTHVHTHTRSLYGHPLSTDMSAMGTQLHGLTHALIRHTELHPTTQPVTTTHESQTHSHSLPQAPWVTESSLMSYPQSHNCPVTQCYSVIDSHTPTALYAVTWLETQSHTHSHPVTQVQTPPHSHPSQAPRLPHLLPGVQ